MIGLVDWGIGGLGIARELREPFLYLSDTGSTPYGKLGRRELAARLRRAVAFLREHGATRVVFACNAASTALPDLEDLADVSGVILPTIDFVLRSKLRSVAVIGGRRTIVSRAYANVLRPLGIDVVQKVAQPLSGMIERGEQKSAAFETAARTILRGTEGCSALLLACTHYPAAMPVFEKIFEGRVIDPAAAIVRSIATKKRAGPSSFFTTGDARAMQRAAKLAWGAKLRAVRVRL